MTDAEPFLKAILADPSNDDARLVFADWLIEECQPAQPERGEFIRVQCSIARGGNGDSRYTALRSHERDLLSSKHSCDWFKVEGLASCWETGKGFVGWLSKRSGEGGTAIPVGIRRGFVESITLSWADWQTHATAILAVAPVSTFNIVDCARGTLKLAIMHMSGRGHEIWIALADDPTPLGGQWFAFSPQKSSWHTRHEMIEDIVPWLQGEILTHQEFRQPA